MRPTPSLIILFALGATVAFAEAVQVRYVGIHPVAKSVGDGICYIEGPHVHTYEADKLQYRDHKGHNHFVGDPVAYGYDGPKKAYKGHHPIHVHATVGASDPHTEYCYLDGPHYHHFAPPPGPEFKVSGDAYFYVGAPPPVYIEARPAYIGINAIYTPIAYTRPSITIAAPVGWIHARPGFAVGAVVGAGVVVGGGVVGPGVVVGGPVVVVRPPSVRIVVPPPPSIRVDVGVGIGVGGKVKVKKSKRRF